MLDPGEDLAGIGKAASSPDAFGMIAKTRARFFSRWDNSGTHKKEMAVWRRAGIEPFGEWYRATNTSMKAALKMTHAEGGYFMCDSSTWIVLRKQLINLMVLFRGDSFLVNAYHALCQPENAMPGQPYAARFTDFVGSDRGQEIIRGYGADTYGQGLYNDAAHTLQSVP